MAAFYYMDLVESLEKAIERSLLSAICLCWICRAPAFQVPEFAKLYEEYLANLER